MKKVYCRIYDQENPNNLNKWGYVEIDQIRKNSSNRYQGRVTEGSENRGAFNPKGLWVSFKKERNRSRGLPVLQVTMQPQDV